MVSNKAYQYLKGSTMIKVYAKLNNIEQLLDIVATGKEVVPLIAHYKRKGYIDFRITE